MRRRTILIGLIGILALLIAVPVLAAGGKGGNAPGQAKEKAPKVEVTLNGTIESAAGADAETQYTLTDGGTTYTLDAGPAWFFGDDYPLKPYVGRNVTVVGEKADGSNEVEVISIDGTALREPGKPPWAGGWKRVGEKHPGWSQDKAERQKAKFGDCFPPGQCKEKPAKGADDADDAEETQD